MHKIGLLGIPGSGKTELATQIAEHFPRGIVVDGYAEALSARLDVYIGPQANYIPNLMIAVEREQRERVAIKDHKNKLDVMVTCGTVLDTLCYVAMKADAYAQQPKTDLIQRKLFREVSASQTLSIMLEDLWSYSHVFYLPPGNDLIDIPGGEPEVAGPFLEGVDDILRLGLFQKWKIPAVTMPRAKGERRLKLVLETILGEQSVGDSDRDSDSQEADSTA